MRSGRIPPSERSGTAVRPPSLADVARQAGVSLATASRALDPTSKHPMAEDTRQRVRRVAGQLGYRPNPMARALRTRRLGTMAVVVHDITDPYFAEIVQGATAAASAEGLLTIVCNSERRPETELTYLEMLRQTRVAAVLFAGGGLEDRDYQRRVRALARGIHSYGGAVVALAPRAESWPSEVCDNRLGAALATSHLVDLGHRDIAVVAGPARLRTSAERHAGYLQAMREAGIEPRAVAEADFTSPGGTRAAARLVEGGRSFTAVLVANDAMAIGVLPELARRGVRVPQDVSVVGFDDLPGLDYLAPPLTTVRVPMAELGAAGVRRALGILAGAPARPRVRVHPVQLVIRGSTASRTGTDARSALAGEGGGGGHGSKERCVETSPRVARASASPTWGRVHEGGLQSGR